MCENHCHRVTLQRKQNKKITYLITYHFALSKYIFAIFLSSHTLQASFSQSIPLRSTVVSWTSIDKKAQAYTQFLSPVTKSNSIRELISKDHFDFSPNHNSSLIQLKQKSKMEHKGDEAVVDPKEQRKDSMKRKATSSDADQSNPSPSKTQFKKAIAQHKMDTTVSTKLISELTITSKR